ncbi:hypothetical protein [Micromonospora sp. WMMD710]|uniref:hypothetical protein n=1 Tax=Micromonospora sp. WMMD710 TaxID=3016085 RepID=UPI002415D95F|nr:hypothetical protein [Micromonospora sp. WMMD710]MDG4756301.1 hypothetical protein [Micromonospora sp. WMMD710]MDG4762444.1 hypothetical protein [Micromonospora sp. WMMD710]MDG4762479.1 hypothetical protein [Micromonospora sp. WMMD710]
MTLEELTERSTEEVARARAERIRQGLRDYLETVAEFALAWERQDWQVLGYADWQAYLDGEFGELRLRVPKVHRDEAVETLRRVGMSTRAIGSTLGISKDTAARAITTVATETDDLPDTVRSLDGRERPANRPPTAPARPAKGKDTSVWVAAARKGIPVHKLRSADFTVCGRSTRNGLTMLLSQAEKRYEVVRCQDCDPLIVTRFAAGEPVPTGPAGEAHDPRASREAGAERRDSAPAGTPTTETATGHLTSRPADGADVGPEALRPGTPVVPDVDHAAPAPAPPAATSSAAGGAGVTPTPSDRPKLALTQIGLVRAALAHLSACGGNRTDARSYEVPYAPTAPCLTSPQPVDAADVTWWSDGQMHVRFLRAGGYCEAATELYAADVNQAIDMLCALRLLPARLSSQYAAGVQAGMRAGNAIDGEWTETTDA